MRNENSRVFPLDQTVIQSQGIMILDFQVQNLARGIKCSLTFLPHWSQLGGKTKCRAFWRNTQVGVRHQIFQINPPESRSCLVGVLESSFKIGIEHLFSGIILKFCAFGHKILKPFLNPFFHLVVDPTKFNSPGVLLRTALQSHVLVEFIHLVIDPT